MKTFLLESLHQHHWDHVIQLVLTFSHIFDSHIHIVQPILDWVAIHRFRENYRYREQGVYLAWFTRGRGPLWSYFPSGE